jgi:hypothetical protein
MDTDASTGSPHHDKDILLKILNRDNPTEEVSIVIPKEIIHYFDFLNEILELHDDADADVDTPIPVDATGLGVFNPRALQLCIDFAHSLHKSETKEFIIKPPRAFTKHTHNFTLKRYGFPEWAVNFFMNVHLPETKDYITSSATAYATAYATASDALGREIPPPKYGIYKMEHYHIYTYFEMLQIAEFFRFYPLRTYIAGCFASFFHHIPEKHIEENLFKISGEYTPKEQEILKKSNLWLEDTRHPFNRTPNPTEESKRLPKYKRIFPVPGRQECNGEILTEQEVDFVRLLHTCHPDFIRLTIKFV